MEKTIDRRIYDLIYIFNHYFKSPLIYPIAFIEAMKACLYITKHPEIDKHFSVKWWHDKFENN